MKKDNHAQETAAAQIENVANELIKMAKEDREALARITTHDLESMAVEKAARNLEKMAAILKVSLEVLGLRETAV